MRRKNPRLIYVSVSAFGPSGPDRMRPGYDSVLQARTGLLSVTGQPGQPPVRVAVSILDLGTGMWGALGALAALYERERTNRGQNVSASLFESGLSLFNYHLASLQFTGETPTPQGSQHPSLFPYGAFRTGQDGFIFIGSSNNRQFRRLAQVLGADAWLSDSRFRTNKDRVANRLILGEKLEAILRKESAVHWDRIFAANDIPSARVQDAREVMSDIQAEALSVFGRVRISRKVSIRLPKLPITLSSHRKSDDLGKPPRLGEHSARILRLLGYDASAISALASSRVIATPHATKDT